MLEDKKETLSKDYVAGLTDGEGCFDLQFRKDVHTKKSVQRVYYYWKVQFVINLRKDDQELLEKTKGIFNCGLIHFTKNDEVRYSIQKVEELHNIIVPFFKEHSLHGKKKKDFELWAEAVNLIFKNKRKSVNVEKGKRGFRKTEWDAEDFARLLEIQKEMEKYKSKRANTPKWTSVAQSLVKQPKIANKEGK